MSLVSSFSSSHPPDNHHSYASLFFQSLHITTEITENGKDMPVTLKALVVVGLAALLCALATATNGDNVHHAQQFTPLVTKESRRTLALTESGMITAVDVHDGYRGGAYHLQFITMEPGSIFLPVLLHTDMVFYVHTGRGTVTFIGEGSEEEIDVVRGDVYRLEQGATFYVKSHPDPARERLRIHAIFGTLEGLSAGVYSNISDLVRGFDDNILQMGFGVSAETIRGIKSAPATSPIVPFSRRNEMEEPNWKEEIIEALFGVRGTSDLVNKKKKKKSGSKAFNFFEAKPDVKNANGWSIALTHKDLKALKGSHLAPFMVNLTRGSMMGPHWNPSASEIAIVIRGQGMVQLVCPSDASGKKIRGAAAAKCQRAKFKVEEGSVFVVPRFHPMSQISFNNETLAFVGFSSATKNNHPQFLAGKRSVLQAIDADVLAAAFNVNSSVAEGLLAAQGEAVMLPCTSCAEEMEVEMEREEEEAKKRKEAEREREEEAKRREEEAARRREEEEAKKIEEEEARRREEEEEARRREEEERRREEEKEAKKREEEEERRREEEEEEEERRRKEEEEEERRREEEEEGRRKEEEEERKREEGESRRREGEGEEEEGRMEK